MCARFGDKLPMNLRSSSERVEEVSLSPVLKIPNNSKRVVEKRIFRREMYIALDEVKLSRH